MLVASALFASASALRWLPQLVFVYAEPESLAMSVSVAVPTMQQWAAVCKPGQTDRERAALALDALSYFAGRPDHSGLKRSLETLVGMVRQVVLSPCGLTHTEVVRNLEREK